MVWQVTQKPSVTHQTQWLNVLLAGTLAFMEGDERPSRMGAHLMQEWEQSEVIGSRALPAGWPSKWWRCWQKEFFKNFKPSKRCCTLFTSRMPSARMISSSVKEQPQSSLKRRTTSSSPAPSMSLSSEWSIRPLEMLARWGSSWSRRSGKIPL